jgi:glycosyltransferase involved in cell wall biosynthesis
MNILQVTHSFPPEETGVGEAVWQLSRHLVARGHRVHVATGLTANATEKECIEGIRVRRFAITGGGLVGIEGDTEGYLEFIQDTAWDAVVFHNLQGWPIELALPRMESFHSPVMVVSHGTFHLKAALPLQGALVGEREERAEQYLRVLARAMRWIDAFVVLSPALLEDPILRELGVSDAVVIRNGVEPARSENRAHIRPQLGIRADPWVIAVSAHSRVKNHRGLFHIARKLHRELPKIHISLIGKPYPASSWHLGRFGVAGGCWYECRMRAVRQPYVQLLPRLSRPDVLAAIGSSDVMVLPSHYEASPFVLLEAMAAGVPWVSTDVGCVRDYAGGIVVGSADEIPDVVVRLIKDPARRSALGQEGRLAAATTHSWAAIAEQHELLYQSSAVRLSKCHW